MKVIVNQYFGIGDIIFCMTIARRWKEEGHEIYWPVLPQFLEGLKRAYPDIIFMDWRTIKIDYERKDEHDIVIDGTQYRIIPLRWNVEIMNVPYSSCMSSKYSLFGWDFKEWKEKAFFERGKAREIRLANEVGDKWDKPYTLINRFFGSNSQFEADIREKGIEMRSVPGYSLFDWAYLIENAETIHTVNSSILYLLELLDLKAKEIHLYSRKPIEPDHRNTEYLFTKPYILHT